MKLIAGALLGLCALLGIAAGAVAMGIVHIPILNTETNVESSPPLQPLPAPSSPPSQPPPAQTSLNADMVLTLSERYVSKLLIQGLPQGGAVQNAQIDVRENNLADIQATVRVNESLTVKPTLSLALDVQAGRLVIDVQKVDLGGFGIPQSLIEPQIADLKQNTETELNRQLADFQKSTGLKLQALSTTNTGLTLYFNQ